jgi:hypothetical protein
MRIEATNVNRDAVAGLIQEDALSLSSPPRIKQPE